MLHSLILNSGFEKLAASRVVYRSDFLGNMVPYDTKQKSGVQDLLTRMEAEKKWNAAAGGLSLGLLGGTLGAAIGKDAGGAAIGALAGAGAGMLLGYGTSALEQSITKDLYGIKDPGDPIPSRMKTAFSDPFGDIFPAIEAKSKQERNPLAALDNGIDSVAKYAPWALGGLAVGGLGYGGYKLYDHLTNKRSN